MRRGSWREGVVVRATGGLRGQMGMCGRSRGLCPGARRGREEEEEEGQPGPRATTWGGPPPAPHPLPLPREGTVPSSVFRPEPPGLLKGVDAQLGPELTASRTVYPERRCGAGREGGRGRRPHSRGPEGCPPASPSPTPRPGLAS